MALSTATVNGVRDQCATTSSDYSLGPPPRTDKSWTNAVLRNAAGHDAIITVHGEEPLECPWQWPPSTTRGSNKTKGVEEGE